MNKYHHTKFRMVGITFQPCLQLIRFITVTCDCALVDVVERLGGTQSKSKMDHLGVPPFQETSIYIYIYKYIHISIYHLLLFEVSMINHA